MTGVSWVVVGHNLGKVRGQREALAIVYVFLAHLLQPFCRWGCFGVGVSMGHCFSSCGVLRGAYS